MTNKPDPWELLKFLGVAVTFEPDMVRAIGKPYVSEREGKLYLVASSWEDVEKLCDQLFLRDLGISH